MFSHRLYLAISLAMLASSPAAASVAHTPVVVVNGVYDTRGDQPVHRQHISDRLIKIVQHALGTDVKVVAAEHKGEDNEPCLQDSTCYRDLAKGKSAAIELDIVKSTQKSAIKLRRFIDLPAPANANEPIPAAPAIVDATSDCSEVELDHELDSDCAASFLIPTLGIWKSQNHGALFALPPQPAKPSNHHDGVIPLIPTPQKTVTTDCPSSARKIAGWSLLVGGAAVAAVGGGLLQPGLQLQASTTSSCTDAQGRMSSGCLEHKPGYLPAAGALLSIGGASLVTGVIVLATTPRSEKQGAAKCPK